MALIESPDPAVRDIELAIAHGDHHRVMEVLSDRPDLIDCRFADNLNLTPLMWAARNRRDSIVAGLIDSGADIDLINRVEPDGDGGNTALWFACQGPRFGGTAIATRLITAGADVNRRCEHGQTAFYIAAAWVHLDVLQLLLDRGADENIPDDQGRTPLQVIRGWLRDFGPESVLNVDQKRFVEAAPRTIDFLESVARPAV